MSKRQSRTMRMYRSVSWNPTVSSRKKKKTGTVKSSKKSSYVRTLIEQINMEIEEKNKRIADCIDRYLAANTEIQTMDYRL